MNKRKMLYWGAASIFAASILLCGMSYYFLLRLVGRRSDEAKRWVSTAAQVYRRIKAVPVSFKTEDGLLLAGRLALHKNAKGTIIFCHGFQRSKERMARFSQLFKNYNQLFFDFRASGQSEGEFSSVGHHEYRDVKAAVTFARRQGVGRPIFLFGVSMGAVAAIKAARRTPGLVDGMILDSAYANLSDEIEHIFGTVSGLPRFPFLPIMLRMFTWFFGQDVVEMHPEDEIAHLNMPIFLIHSSTDQFTLPNHTVRLYAQAGAQNKQARIWIGPPAKHGHLYDTYPEYYEYKINKFLRKAGSWLREALSRDVIWQP